LKSVASEDIDVVEAAPTRVAADAVSVPAHRPVSSKEKMTYALVILLLALGGVAWWWFHRPAPAYRAKDPGIYPFWQQSKVGFIDAQGNTLVQPQWDEVALDWVVGATIICNEDLCGVKKDGKWGYINKQGNPVIMPQFNQVRPFIDGIAAVALGNQWGFIDKTGHYLINPQFQAVGDFHNGLAAATKEGKWGFIGPSGTFVIQPIFAAVDTDGFVDGLAWAQSEGKCGYIKGNGTFAISRQFEGCSNFSEGLARVRVAGKWGYVNSGGKIVINPQFDEAWDFSGGHALVGVSGHRGTIGKNGLFVINPGQYDIPGFIGNASLLAVSTKDGLGFMSKEGNWILNPSQAVRGFWWPRIGDIIYVVPNSGDGSQIPVSTSGKVLAGWYKGSSLQTLAQDIDNGNNAIQSMSALVAAEANYSSVYPGKGFAGSIAVLGPAQGTVDENHAGLIGADLATGTKDNYQFTINIPEGTSSGGINFNYLLAAKPVAGHTGRIFCADSTGTIRYALQGTECTTASPTL
jgi:hypothetical protein